ncbi:MAG: phage tail sheath family protein [Alphaproteobacteria bacterium]|nr:phage tail sheath family protein [Alphaproteobacteria bacterium]
MPEIHYPGVYVEETGAPPRAIAGVPTAVAAFVGFTVKGPRNRAVAVADYGEFVARFGAAAPGAVLPLAVRDFFANGGTAAVVVRCAGTRAGKAAAPTTGQIVGTRRARTGLHALAAPTRFNLLCVPDAARPLPGSARPDRRVDAAKIYAAAAALCAERRAILLVDPPADCTTIEAALAWRQTLPRAAAANAAAYWPRLRDAADPAGAPGRAPSGAIAGVIARTDAARGLWKAPAGPEATVAGTAGPTVSIDERGQGRLNAAAVNVIRHFGGRGVLVWGARTLAGDDGGDPEFRYVPVRRLVLHVGESLAEGLKPAAFGCNGPALWARLRRAAEGFLMDLFRLGAFAGRSPREAFFARCDATTTTQADIDAGRVHVEVGVAPLKPAEFVVIRLGIWTSCDA